MYLLRTEPSMRALALLVALSLGAQAQAPNPGKERAEYVRSHYAKFEYRIPMRDGKKLFTSVYVPNDVHFGQKYPILLQRTPYSVSPYGLDRYKDSLGPTATYEKEKFIFAYQDVRGRWMSEGDYVNMRPRNPGGVDESTDTYDTISFLVKQVEGNNGKVGLWGISYPGFYAAYGAIDSHPALKAVSPQAPIADWWRGDDMHRNGAFNLLMSFHFFANFGKPRPTPTAEPPKPFEYDTVDAYEYFLELGPLRNALKRFGFKNEFWEQLVAHPDYDEFWQARNLLPHLKNVKSSLLIVGGWFDSEDLYGPLQIYQSVRKLNPTTPVHLVMGPWIHGGWWRTEGKTIGDADFGYATATTYLEAELAYFQHHLKGKPEINLPGAWIFETGANRWRSFPVWPPTTSARHFYFQRDEKLSTEPPRDKGQAQFVSDPHKPVPYTQNFRSMAYNRGYMAEDQRYAARRPDVLVFQTPPLSEDTTVAGPLEAELYVSTSAQDADWIVKLIDVSPGRLQNGKENQQGSQQTLIRGEPIRGRYRDSWSQPRPFEPNRPTRVRFQLNDVCHTFQRGHRIMVQLQSSWFPYLDRNPQKWVDNIFEAGPHDFIPATHRVYFEPQYPSRVTLPILES